MEDAEHIIKCPMANLLWIKIQQILTEWGTNNRAAPRMITALLTGLHQWREYEPSQPPHGISNEIKEAFLDQTQIGYNAALKGFLSQKWQ
eukprot:11878656-Ditylum_brightwellii.AAC.1